MEDKTTRVVRIQDGIVVEVIPDAARPVAEWYNEEFAKQCVEAPDYVEQHWYYDTKTKAFRSPEEGPFLETNSEKSFEKLLDSILS